MRSLIISSFFVYAALEGAYPQGPPFQFDALRHQISNQEIEIRAFEQRLESFQVMLEGLQEQIQVTATVSKDQIKGNATALETRITSLENANKNLGVDLQQLRLHANETTATFSAFKKTFQDYDQRIKNQNQNIENLSSAIQTLLEAFNIKSDLIKTTENTDKVYKVKAGDSLDKIAKANGTSVKELMRLNNLSSPDKIVVGKTLKLSE